MQKIEFLSTAPLINMSSPAMEAAGDTKCIIENEDGKRGGGESALHAQAIKEPRTHKLSTNKETKLILNRLRYAPSLAAVQVAQDEWRLWGSLCVSGKYRSQDILVLIEIAEDFEFKKIIHKGKVIASKKNNFAINYTYTPSCPDAKLFYRFKMIRARAAENQIHRERKIVISTVGEMRLWK